MRGKILWAAVLTWIAFCPSSVMAQGSGGLLEEIGQALFGPRRPAPQSANHRPLGPKPTTRSYSTQPRPTSHSGSSQAVAARPSVESSAKDDDWLSISDLDSLPAEVTTPNSPGSSERTGILLPGTASLHERLSAIRGSTSGQSAKVSSSSQISPGSPAPARTASVPSTASARRSLSTAQHSPAAAKPTPTLAKPLSAKPLSDTGIRTPRLSYSEYPEGHGAAPGGAEAAGRPRSSDSRTALQAAVANPRVASRTTLGDETRPQRTEPQTATARQEDPSSTNGEMDGTAVSDSSHVRAAQVSPAAASHGNGNLLFTRQGPLLSVETAGPRRIAVGKQSTYEVAIQNAGQVAAEQVVVTVDLPAWADTLGMEPSTGTTESVNASGDDPRPLRWMIPRLEASGREKLVLKIVPRESRPLDLSVKWDYTPVASQAVIEVQEAKLSMELHGPREVSYGKPEIYRLEITNTGNGDAEQVLLSLFPMGPSESPPATHQFGTLAAGDKKAVEVELTARHTGTLTIKVDAQAAGGTEAHLAEKILVRKAGLAVAVEAPAVQYVGSDATYRIRVSNPGNAPTKGIRVTADLPPEVKYVSSVPSGQLDPSRGKLTWAAEDLSPGGETVYLVNCNLHTPGSVRLNVAASADDDLLARGEGETQVDAIADLALNVSDPSGPVAVGKDAIYEIQVQNRGTKSAENVEVVVYFSHGIEPTSADGGENRIGPGQVVFDPISSLAAGQSLVLKIHARADAPGNHVFRAEVHCKSLGTRLVSEETTHFYSIAGTPSTGNPTATANPPATENPAPAADTSGTHRTADRRGDLALTPDPQLPTPAPPKN